MTKRSWVQTPTVETIFQAPFIWIKAWNKICLENSNLFCNPANGRVDFVELLAYKIQGTDWIVSLSADWDQSPPTPHPHHPPQKKDNISQMMTITTRAEIVIY